jgi:acyl CoA:acetate/3-ketoacid CoA transferase alpha subunit
MQPLVHSNLAILQAGRIRAAGAGIGALYTPTAYGTMLAESSHILEYLIHANGLISRLCFPLI